MGVPYSAVFIQLLIFDQMWIMLLDKIFDSICEIGKLARGSVCTIIGIGDEWLLCHSKLRSRLLFSDGSPTGSQYLSFWWNIYAHHCIQCSSRTYFSGVDPLTSRVLNRSKFLSNKRVTTSNRGSILQHASCNGVRP